MEQIVQYMRDAGAFYLATADETGASVRPFGSIMVYNGRLWFCTESTKPVYDQLVEHPVCEMCALGADGEWLRLRGKAVFADDLGAKKAMFQADPALDSIYESPDNPTFVVFYLEEPSALLYPHEGEPTKIL